MVVWTGAWDISAIFFQAEDGIRDGTVTGVQTCALPIFHCHEHDGDEYVCGYSFIRLGHRSEEHTSELQSQFHLACRLLLEKKKTRTLAFCIASSFTEVLKLNTLSSIS